jgi:hypothetical protein
MGWKKTICNHINECINSMWQNPMINSHKNIQKTGKGREQGKKVGGWIRCKYCVHIYVNVKMIPVETILGMRGGGNSSMIYPVS